ncbi:hypothetical protein E2320_014448 [Naja naja]|nr:hypothetical protein E2320_014448 [Naja naja]
MSPHLELESNFMLGTLGGSPGQQKGWEKRRSTEELPLLDRRVDVQSGFCALPRIEAAAGSLKMALWLGHHFSWEVERKQNHLLFESHSHLG